MENKKLAIIFDLDGTLWNSTGCACDIWNRVLEKHTDISFRMTREKAEQLMGKTMEDIGKMLFPELSAKARNSIVDEFGEEEVRYLSENGAILYEGLEDTLNTLIRQYKLYIVSNCQDGYVPAFLYAHKLERYFADIEMSGRTGLDKGNNIKLIMKRNGIESAIYIGDTDGDEKAARFAGIPFIYAKYGFGEAVSPDAIITDIRELPECITKLSKKELLFYDAYEAFYVMAKESKAFRAFCKDAFGEDFSQDGFSNIEQTDMILQYIPKKDNVHILDIGCGNGKMLGYLQKKTKANIHGFDYSEEAIKTAQVLFPENSEFREGVIGEIDYPEEKFDVIISMDTMYFAKDMTAFVAQVKKWLKKDGVFFVGYQEGDVIPKTENIHTTILSKAVESNGMNYVATDITEQTYELLKTKRIAAMAHQQEFETEGHKDWFDMLIGQTEYAMETFGQFKEKMARYIYVIRK